jgi:CBS domain-containing protein
MDPVLAHQSLMDFASRRGEAALRLAMHAALPQRFRTELLHLIRLNFVPGADSAAESDVLLADFCLDVGGGYYRFDPEVQNQLLDGLAAEYGDDEPRVLRVARFLAAWLQQSDRAGVGDREAREYRAILAWVSLAYLRPELAAEQLAKALDGSIQKGDAEAQLQLSGIVASVAQPLVSHPRLLAYAAGLQALEEGRPADAEKLLKPLEGLEVERAVRARSANELVDRWRKRNLEAAPAPETAPVRATVRPLYSNFIDVTGIPVGHQRAVAFLEEAWKRGLNLVQIVGGTGSGKTALLADWKGRHSDEVSTFAWSFSFGRSPEEFAEELVAWLGVSGIPESRFVDIARTLADERVLMVLGDVERSPDLTWLLRTLATRNAGMVAISTRVPRADIPDGDGQVEYYDLEDDGEPSDWRELRRIVDDYQAGDRKKPLSVAALGWDVSDVIARTRETLGPEFMEVLFEVADLGGMDFDSALGSIVTGARTKLQVVFWNDFDTSKFRWLEGFAGAMQSEIGNCIFVFTGGSTRQEIQAAHPAFAAGIWAWIEAPKVVAFGDKVVREVMTPRANIVAIQADETLEALHELVSNEPYSRIPVYQTSIDDIKGFVHARDMFEVPEINRRTRRVRELVRPIRLVPETMPVEDLMREMRQEGSHLTIVIDEYGKTAGLASMEDLLEVIVGEIRDEPEPTPDVTEDGRGGVERPEAELLLNEIQNPSTTHARRWEIGVRLAEIDDPRRGVGIVNGLPELVLVPVPGGVVELENKGGVFTVHPFRISRYPITFAQFRAFVDAGDGYGDERWWKGLQREEPHQAWRDGTGNEPVTRVSWYDATAFCRWLTVRLQEEIRLPDQQEWQWAAQSARRDFVYPWGTEWDGSRANTREGGIQKVTAVGMYPAGESLQGVADLAGTVWEWCRNQYGDPTKTAEGGEESRVLRGGCWDSSQFNARAGYRINLPPRNRYNHIGFRVVCSSPIAER